MLSKKELLIIKGGAKISGAIINAAVRVIGVILEVGRSLGSAIRRGIARKACTV